MIKVSHGRCMFCICRHTPFGICPASMMQDAAPSFAEQIFMRGVSSICPASMVQDAATSFAKQISCEGYPHVAAKKEGLFEN